MIRAEQRIHPLPLTALALTAAVSMTGCAADVVSAPPTESRLTQTAQQRDCPDPVEPNGRGKVNVIDWGDFIRFRGRTYDAVTDAPSKASSVTLGDRVGIVHCQLAGTEPNGYKIRNGDAPYLTPGTPIYAVQGASVDARLAVQYDDGRLMVYAAD